VEAHTTLPPRVRRKPPARTQVLISAAGGLIVGVPVALLTTWDVGVLGGYDACALFYVGWVWSIVRSLDGRQTAALVEREDPTRATADLMLLTAAIASLGAVVVELAQAAGAATGADLRTALAVASVALSWVLVHTVYTLRYARMYYRGEDGGVDFNGEASPNYRDFAYLGFTIGMTYQVSDTALRTHEFRVVALRHALLSFVFGTGILATTINLVASITSK
jgi:uncharacterized membrane protein